MGYHKASKMILLCLRNKTYTMSAKGSCETILKNTLFKTKLLGKKHDGQLQP
jgi:hypothetical protein